MFQKFTNFAGPKKWVFKDPDTGTMIAGRDKKELFTNIVNYRIQNKLAPITALSAVIDNYLCGLPENTGACEPTQIRRGIMAYIKGGIALLEQLYYGEQNMVPQEVADTRAEQCSTCPHNIFPDKEQFIKWSDEIAEHSTDGKRTQLHDQLGSCAVCTCTLKAKVFYKGPYKLSKEEIIKMEEVNCWQLNNIKL